MIELSRLEEMFANIRAKTPWNMDGSMLWGYFFFDPREVKLRLLAERLVGQGYRLVSLGAMDGVPEYRLHVERVEVHSPDSLFERNAELGELARKFGVASYDGMDVGPVGN